MRSQTGNKLMKDSILYFNEIGLEDISKVGRKNASIGEIFQQLSPKGVLVPDGFATTAKVYREFLRQNHLEGELSSILNDLDTKNFSNLSEIGKKIRTLLKKGVFPYYTQVQIIAAYHELAERVEMECSIAVRSSAVTEGVTESNFAGQLESYLNIKGEDALLTACKNCFVSLYSDKAIKHSFEMNIDHRKVTISVGFHQMVPQDELNDSVEFTLNEEDQQTLSQWSNIIDNHFERPMNIEWVKGQMDGKLYIIQASPEY